MKRGAQITDADFVSTSSAKAAEIRQQLREAVMGAIKLWDGDKITGPKRFKRFQRFLKWKPYGGIGRAPNKPQLERHYNITEIAGAWNFSPDLVRNIFRDEPGILTVEHPATRRKMSYSTMTIPESVVLRVHTKLVREANAIGFSCEAEPTVFSG